MADRNHDFAEFAGQRVMILQISAGLSQKLHVRSKSSRLKSQQ